MIRLLKIAFWALAVALVISDFTMLGLMYLKPRDLLREYIEEPRANYHLLAINDYRSMRSGDISWTFAVQKQHELTLVSRCKRGAVFGAVGAIYKIDVAQRTPSNPPTDLPSKKEKMDDTSGCLLAEWQDANRNGGGEAILFGNLVQINIWYD